MPQVSLYHSGSFVVANFGQDSTFAGAVSSGGNTDANGIGDFKYAVPSGYKALCSANLPDPTILLPNKHFEARTYTGTATGSGTQTLTGFQFQPDWVWIKSRGIGYSHLLVDAVRGASKGLLSEGSDSEETSNGYGMLTAFTSDGYTMTRGSSDGGKCCENTQPYVSWNWNAGDADSKTYTVTVVSDSGNKYRFDGFGTSAVTLDLAEGGTYIFNYPSAHPFKFSTTSDGTHGGGSEYTTGVTHNSSTQVTIVVAASAPQLFYYCGSHSGMGGAINTNSTSGSSNFDGTTQSVTKVDASAGFSITKYTGTGSNTNIGHGLGVAPQVVITKSRSAAGNWPVLHTVGDPNAEFGLFLNDNGGYSSYQGGTYWNDTVPTSTHFRVSSNASTNGSGVTYIAYVFSEVAGYSKFGKYIGNGSSDGTFVFTGFTPAFLIVKKTNSGNHWVIYDNKRSTFNVIDDYLKTDTSDAESTTSIINIDFLSNGFKFRSGYDIVNAGNYIYLAFAESPFKNARAR
ncbi:hypothetical protein [Marinobacter sp.]|uniref:DUF7483 domain-containing protein n=1 Tax=Marinobacter sp. TaxID=50741 RepID=UPI0023562336|nr:hypothetical protein [Marinobacter sp.]